MIYLISHSCRSAPPGKEWPIRRALRLRSTFFILSRTYDENHHLEWLVIRGAGWGHGVGLCQVGAIMVGKRGHDYTSILKHYFHGIEIYKIYQ